MTIVLCCQAGAQVSSTTKVVENAYDEVKDKTSLKYDVLAELLQVGIDKGLLTGDKSNVNFKSTAYGLMTLFNKDYEKEENYSQLRFQRNLEVGTGLQFGEGSKINGFNLSLKYAIINNRDLSVRDVTQLAPQVQAIQQAMAAHIAPKLQAFLNDPARTAAEIQKATSFLTSIPNITDFPKFYQDAQLAFPGANIGDPAFFINLQTRLNALNAAVEAQSKAIQKRGLLTFSSEAKNSDKIWDFAKFKLEYIKGLGFVKDDQNPWDFYLSATVDMNRDTVVKGNTLSRTTGAIKGGINHVLIKKNNQSLVEVLGGFEHNSVFSNKYAGEKDNQFNALFTMSFRLAPNLYLPLELKYDPEAGNLFGFVRVKWDMLRSTK